MYCSRYSEQPAWEAASLISARICLHCFSITFSDVSLSTASIDDASWLASWASEVANYTYASNTCAAGKVCGHYTQVVWRATTEVGCALADCPALQFKSTVVCDYGPGGNSGGKPY